MNTYITFRVERELRERKKDINVRTARREDFPILENLHRLSMYKYISNTIGWNAPLQHQRLLRHFSPHTLYFVVTETEVVGSYNVSEREEDLYLSQFYITPDYQSKGLGSSILRGIQSVAAEEEKSIRLSVLKGSPARLMYEKHGFVYEKEDQYQDYMIWACEPLT